MRTRLVMDMKMENMDTPTPVTMGVNIIMDMA